MFRTMRGGPAMKGFKGERSTATARRRDGDLLPGEAQMLHQATPKKFSGMRATVLISKILVLYWFYSVIMKNIFTLLAVLSLGFLSCDDNNGGTGGPGGPGGPVTVKYTFNANVPGSYKIYYYLDTANANPNGSIVLPNISSWEHSIQANSGKVTRLRVLPPDSWAVGQTSPATIKIFVNNVEKASFSGVIEEADRASGITTTAAY